jgi:probable phosphoglycerate mutase
MAFQVGQALRDIQLNAVYSSPLQRAHRTAELVVSQLNQAFEVIPHPHLKEVNLPAWEGLTFDQVMQQDPESYWHWRKEPQRLKMPCPTNHDAWEDFYPIDDLYDRARRFWQTTIPEHFGQTILIVGHSGINRALINTAVGLGPEAYQRIDQSNCCISVLNFAGGFGDLVQVESINLTSHWGQPIPPLKQADSIRLLLVRHGETQWNREGRFQGQIDVPLNEQGRHQAHQAADFLKLLPLDAAVSSPMARPRETAEIILQHHTHLTLNLQDGLREISHGLWEGKLEAEIDQAYPNLLKQWQTQPQVVQMPEGENLQQVWDRAIATWQSIVDAAQPGTTTLVVAHDAINKAILCHVAGLGPSAFWNFKQGNGAVSVIDYIYGSDGPPMLRAANITTHLGGVLDTTAAGAL